jgi:hypothetical protein
MRTMVGSSNCGARPLAEHSVGVCLASALAVIAAGCDSGHGPVADTPAAPMAAPTISEQPVDQSVPMGLAATFSVTASGASLQYQWKKNGAAVNGATGRTYRTPATAFADGGASYTVGVSNSGGTSSSNRASLTVTARAPTAGDLRFQQVDAAWVVNGWGNAGVGQSTNLPGRSAAHYSAGIGTPFYVGSNGDCGSTPSSDGTGCTWFYSVTPAGAPSNDSVTVGYVSDSYDSFQADLQSTGWPSFNNGVNPVSSRSVITSMDLEPSNALFALSWIQSNQQTGFVSEQNTVAPKNLQAAVTEEGLSGRVVTAVSNDGGQITYLAYGWQADTATLYEAQAVTASTAGAPAAAASLAAQGYIITATGQADGKGNIVIVGTRVQGDTAPRPFMAAQGSLQIQTMQQQGYANVGVIFNSSQSDAYTFLGER